MFSNNKDQVERKEINNFHRIIIEYSSDEVMKKVLKEIFNDHENMMLLYDTDLINHNRSVGIDEQIKGFKKIFFQLGIPYDLIKTKSSQNKGVLQKIFSIGKTSYDYEYKLSAIIEQEDIDQIVDYHLKNKANIHIGIDFYSKEPTQAMKDFISNMIDDTNRFDYYKIDLFVNVDLNRIAFFSEEKEQTDQLAEKIQKIL